MPTNLDIKQNIIGTSPLSSAAVERQLKEILRAQPWIECNLIGAKTEGSRVILTGCVYSTGERDQVEAAARKLTSVTEVDNRLTLIKEQQTQNG